MNKLNLITDFLKEDKKFFIVIIVSMLVAIFETLGISSIIPLISLITDQNYLISIKKNYSFLDFNFLNENNFKIILISCIILIFVIKNIFYLYFIYLQANFVSNFRFRLSNRLYKNILNSDYSLFLQNNLSDLIKIINLDTENLRYALSFIIIGMAELIITTFILMYLFYFNFYMTLFILIIILVGYLMYKFWLKFFLRKVGENKFQNLSKLQIKVKETLNNIKIIKIFSSQIFFYEAYKNFNRMYRKSLASQDFLLNLPKAIIELLAIFVLMFFLIISNHNNGQNYIFSTAGVFALAFFRLMPALNRITSAISTKDLFFFAGTKIEDFLKNKTKINDNLLVENLEPKKITNISIKNLTFSFSKKNIIFDKINLNIEQNQFIGIIGSSGAGKTTFLNLILGLLKPSGGQVLYNNSINIFENLHLFKNKISYVPQKIEVIEASIAENIAFGICKNEINYEKLQEVIIKTNLVSLTKKMNGVEAIIKDDNNNISGGELQRLGIARALYFDSDILILDEATNALDQKNEEDILGTIYKNFLGKKIIIFITHKISNLKLTNYIIKIKNNKLEKIDFNAAYLKKW